MSWVVTSKGDFSVEALLLLITMPVPQDWPEARLCFPWQVSLLREHQRGQATIWTLNLSTEQNTRVYAQFKGLQTGKTLPLEKEGVNDVGRKYQTSST